jgi:8-oxo-dGTP diphosphatase
VAWHPDTVTPMGVLDGWRFCPRCGAAADHRGDHVACPACGHVVWANPVPGVHALIERDGKVLLGRRAFDPGAGCWGLPGGFLEETEGAEAGLRREVREETGLEIAVGELFGTWLQPHGERTVLCLIYRARPVGGAERAADDVTELSWFAPVAIPDDVGPSAFAEAVALWRQQHA